MKVLIFSTAYRPLIGGSELALESIARHMPEASFDILTPRYSRKVPAYERFGNMDVYRLGLGVPADKFFLPLLGFITALKLIKNNKYTALHAYQASYAALAAAAVRMVKNIPYILTLQEGKNLQTQSWPVRFLRWAVIRRADCFTAISEYLAKYIFSQKPGAVVKLIANGVDYGRFSDVNLKSHADVGALLGIDPNQHIIMTVSRLVPKNGIAVLIKALRVVRLKLPAALVVVGEGPLRKTLEGLAKDIGMDRHTVFTGAVSNHHIPKYLAVAGVFVRPSVSEGMGSAFLEAMAAGVPVVGTGVGGISDFLEHGRTGLLCDGTDPESVAKQIIDLLEQPALRESINRNAAELVRAKYDWSIIAGEMYRLYISVAIV